MLAVALASGCGAAANAEVSAQNTPEESDAARAWREAVAEPDSATRTATLRALAPAVAELDPRAALLLAKTLRGDERAFLISAAWRAWGQQDALAALAGLKELPELATGQGCIANYYPVYQVLEGWTQTDPQAAFAWIAADPTTDLWVDLPLWTIATSNVADALSLVEQLEGTPRRLAVNTVLGVWAKADPHAAAAWVDDASPEDAAAAIFQVASAWAVTWPEQALDWVDTLPEDIQLDATHAVIVGAAITSPDVASGLLGRIRDPQRRLEASLTLIAHWADAAPQDARRWIAQVVDDETRRALYVRLFRTWVGEDRRGAAEELREIADHQHRDAAAFTILYNTISDLRFAAERAQREGQQAVALGGDIDFVEGLYGRIRDAKIRQDVARMFYDALREIAPERVERYRAIAGVIDESNTPE